MALHVYKLDDPEKHDEMGEYGLNRVKTELVWGDSKSFLLEAYSTIFPANKSA